MYSENLYEILNLNPDSNISEIKKSFRKLALQHHPDKNNNIVDDKFYKILIAYQILSNSETKKKYDQLKYKSNFINKLLVLLKELANPLNINCILDEIDIIDDLNSGDLKNVGFKIIKKLFKDADNEIKNRDLANIFIQTSENNSTSFISSLEYSYNTSNYNTLNIIGNIITNLYDIYNNNYKQITIERKIIENDEITKEKLKFEIPLYNKQVIISEAGDKLITDDTIEIGDVILKILVKKEKNNLIKKNKYNLIYEDTITLYELFNGFEKIYNIYDNKIIINSLYPFKDYSFDGNILQIIERNKGFPKSSKNNFLERGDLIFNLKLIKDNNFNHVLELLK